jgi:hypothetical protein
LFWLETLGGVIHFSSFFVLCACSLVRVEYRDVESNELGGLKLNMGDASIKSDIVVTNILKLFGECMSECVAMTPMDAEPGADGGGWIQPRDNVRHWGDGSSLLADSRAVELKGVVCRLTEDDDLMSMS